MGLAYWKIFDTVKILVNNLFVNFSFKNIFISFPVFFLCVCYNLKKIRNIMFVNNCLE